MGVQDDFFASMHDALEGEARREKRQETFEDSTVKRLLRYAGVSGSWGWAYASVREEFNIHALTFQWLNYQYPAFPVQLASHKAPGFHEIKLSQVFGKNFMKLAFVKSFMDVATQMGWNVSTERVGLVFYTPRADKAGVMVLHNQPMQVQNVMDDPEQRIEPETRILRPFGNPRIVYVIESFNSFMATVGTEWADEG
ncbi:MAG TPA: hypothetical protein VMX56_09560 [Anaerolineales bacterium]|nr:hypothetical protein [Anaerolineales bacterium]